MLNLIVAGAGEGLYKNLGPALRSKNPELDMHLAVVIDVKEFHELHSESKKLVRDTDALYLSPQEIRNGSSWIPRYPAAIVMTPNDSHLEYARFFAERGVPVYVEKPQVTSLEDLPAFIALAEAYPQQIYAAEYVTDGKALPLLWASGVLSREAWQRQNLFSGSIIRGILKDCGLPKQIVGTTLEGSGTAATADHRPWLLDGKHGGMIRDLASHIFGPLYDMGFTSSAVLKAKVTLGRYEPGTPLGTFRDLKNADEGETYAKITGQFATPHGLIPFHFEVGKYWPKHERELRIVFEGVEAVLSYESPFQLVVRGTKNSETYLGDMKVETDHYPSLALFDFQNFATGKERTHGHIGRAIEIIRFNETMRALGTRNLG